MNYHFYELLSGEGRASTGSVNVAFQLLDVTDADGGFVVGVSAGFSPLLSSLNRLLNFLTVVPTEPLSKQQFETLSEIHV